ncbi:MAG: hypothetical protein QOE37_61 [Microbacteriaceae bacterium]|nr:hypothetical protein [Microbacteriaceae bacterium]
MITLPRPLLVALGAGFSLYHVVLGITSLSQNPEPVRVIAALVLYAVATALSLTVGRRSELPPWLAGLNVGLSISMALLVSSTLDPTKNLGYGTWYVAAVGTLLTITAVRRHTGYAWFGLGLLTAQTVVWAGPLSVTRFGVLGDVVWIAVAHAFTRALVRATLDVRQFARAEREAVEWQAAQDAHHFERQVRLTQTSRMAMPMLRRIAELNGDLDEADRHECRVLEETIRDEIRGRRLLNDAVREQVIEARRRGAFVQVLDDGGVDDIDPDALEPVLNQVAEAIAGVRSDRLIIRTAPRGSQKAVTVVGISSDPTAAALGLEDDDETVDLWLEIDRPVPVAP